MVVVAFLLKHERFLAHLRKKIFLVYNLLAALVTTGMSLPLTYL